MTEFQKDFQFYQSKIDHNQQSQMTLMNRFVLHLIDQIILHNKTERRFVEFLKALVIEVARDPVQFVYDNFNNVKMDKFEQPSAAMDAEGGMNPGMVNPNLGMNPNSSMNPGMGMNPNMNPNMNPMSGANDQSGFNDARGRKRVAITEEQIKSIELDNLEGVRQVSWTKSTNRWFFQQNHNDLKIAKSFNGSNGIVSKYQAIYWAQRKLLDNNQLDIDEATLEQSFESLKKKYNIQE